MIALELDMRSLLGVAAVTELLFGLMLLSAWSAHRADRALVYWSLGSICVALSCMGAALRGQIPDFLSIEITNVLVYASLALRLAGLRSFDGHPTRLGWLLIPAFVIGVLFHFREPLGLEVARRVTIALVVSVGFGMLLLTELLRAQRREVLRMRHVVIGLIGLQTLNDLLRLFSAVWGGFPTNQYLEPQALFVLLVLTVLSLYGVLNLACFMMVFERREGQLVRAATVDTLTQVLNRAGFSQLAERSIQRSRTAREPSAVLVMDLDHFKVINDRHGHDAGDEVLRAFARSAAAAMRPSDVLSRPGGEEFWALLPDADLAEGHRVAERIRREFRTLNMSVEGRQIVGSVSVGVAELRADEALDSALRRADQAMYAAKQRGRDQVVLADAGSTVADEPHLLPT